MNAIQKPNPFSVTKQAFLFVYHNWQQAFAILAIPVVISFVVSFLRFIPTIGEKANLIQTLLNLPIDAFISVYWCCLVLRGEKIKGIIAPLRFRKIELRYLWAEFLWGMLLLLLLILGFILTIKPLLSLDILQRGINGLTFHMPNIENISMSHADIYWLSGGILWMLASLFCIMRFVFVFPTIALGGARNFRNSWRQMRGITLRFLLSMGLATLALVVISGIIGAVEVGIAAGLRKIFSINIILDHLFSILGLLSKLMEYLFCLVAMGITASYYEFRNPDVRKS